MAEQGEQRRLAAIFVADMVGYSRLMEADERGTIARQKSHRAELIDPKIADQPDDRGLRGQGADANLPAQLARFPDTRAELRLLESRAHWELSGSRSMGV